MVREAIGSAIAAANSATGIVALFLAMGIWLGVQQAQLWGVMEFVKTHSVKAAHEGQAKRAVEVKLLLELIRADLASIKVASALQKADILTTVATKLSDDRFRRQDMAALCHKLEEMNTNFKCPPLYTLSVP